MIKDRQKAAYALGALVLFGSALMAFIFAATEQAVISNGRPEASRIDLKDLVAQGPGDNNHIELTGFHFGKSFIYNTELITFNEVYVPVFSRGEPEDGARLHVLLRIQNDRNSNEPLIQTREELSRFVDRFNRDPTSVTGVLQKPIASVRSLTIDTYPGTNGESLQVLWARHFPTQGSANALWLTCALCLGGTAVCVALCRRRQ